LQNSRLKRLFRAFSIDIYDLLQWALKLSNRSLIV